MPNIMTKMWLRSREVPFQVYLQSVPATAIASLYRRGYGRCGLFPKHAEILLELYRKQGELFACSLRI